MNYKRIYFNIIRNRRANPLDTCIYGEEHHIIPRSFGGGNHKANLVRLTAREHFVVHFLLYKMYKHRSQVLFQNSQIEAERYRKMAYAFNLMINIKTKKSKRLNKNINSHVFEKLRKDISKYKTKYTFELVKEMFDFYIKNELSPTKIDVLNKQFYTKFTAKALKKLFNRHNLKLPIYIKPKYSKEMVEEMFEFYIKNKLTSKTIDVLNKKFNTDFKYPALLHTFHKNNLKISKSFISCYMERE